jgi:hypothetical protein
MKGDFSRLTFENAHKKHYSTVYSQQGKVQLDADFNEQQAIHRHHLETSVEDITGQAGTPRPAPGFEITTDGTMLRIAKGCYYVDGILCENEERVRYTPDPSGVEPHQPDLLNPPALPTLLGASGRGVVYLDVWERHITAQQDDQIREKALNGTDTTTRGKTVWQVKVLPIAGSVTAEAIKDRLRKRQDLGIPEWTQLTIKNKGTMNARSDRTDNTGVDNTCLVAPQAGYQGLENQLYRIEIHRGGDRNNATYKFSRDNGIITAVVEQISRLVITVTDTGRDEILGFKAGDWVELVSDYNELSEPQIPGPLIKIDTVNPATREIVLKSAPPAVPQNELKQFHYLLRRWDMPSSLNMANGMSMQNNWAALENGIQVLFSSTGQFLSGDYWLIPARTVLGEIEWPPFTIPNTTPQAVQPQGVNHHYSPLALVTLSGGTLLVSDLRLMFPPLNHITAAEVFYDNSACQADLPAAKTVQNAIDTLCQRRGGRCQIHLAPGPGWETPLLALAGSDAEICFQAGVYETDRRVVVRNKGHLKITGVGQGTHIIAKSDEAALEFFQCRSVTIRDLYVESRKAGSPPKEPQVGQISGALTFRSCGSVTVEHVALKCASASDLCASCLTIINPSNRQPTGDPGDGSVRIFHCDLRVGFLQAGILLVNVTRARVSDNLIRAGKKHEDMVLEKLLKNLRYRSAVRELLINTVVLDPTAAPPAGSTAKTITLGTMSVRFETHPIITNGWTRLFNAIRPKGVQNSRDLRWFLENVIDRLLLHQGDYPGVKSDRTVEFEEFYRLLQQSMQSVGGQGIIVGGQTGKDIQIDKNTIVGMQVGIKTGVSHDYNLREPHDRLESVHIEGNDIEITLAPSARLRFGIFVGNCNRLLIENNTIRVTKLPVTQKMTLDGIRVWGLLGERMVIRQNSILDATTGIRINPTNSPAHVLWIVKENVMPGEKFNPPANVIHDDTNVT